MWTINLTILPRLLELTLAMISVMLTTYTSTNSLPIFVTFGHVHGLILHILIVITCATSMRTKKVSSVGVSMLKSFQPLEKVTLISNTSFLNKGSMELLLLLQESKKQREELKSQTWDPESLSVHLQHPCGMPPFWREIDRWPSKIQLNIQNFCKLKRDDEESYSRGALHAGGDIKHNLVLKRKHDPNATEIGLWHSTSVTMWETQP